MSCCILTASAAAALSTSFLALSSLFLASLESGTGLKTMSVREQEFPSPRFHWRVKMADWLRWHSEPSGFGGGLGGWATTGAEEDDGPACWPLAVNGGAPGTLKPEMRSLFQYSMYYDLKTFSFVDVLNWFD